MDDSHTKAMLRLKNGYEAGSERVRRIEKRPIDGPSRQAAHGADRDFALILRHQDNAGNVEIPFKT